MQPFVTRIKTNLNGVLQMTQMVDGIMMTGDDRANQIIVELSRDRQRYEIPSGTKITGYFIRSDGYTLEIDGEVSDGNANIYIPALAYQIPGILSIAVRMFMDPSEQTQRGYYSSETSDFVIVTDPTVTEGPNGEPVVTRTAIVYANKIVIAAASCFVQMTETSSVIEPGHMIPDINDVIAKLEEMDEHIRASDAAEDVRQLAENARISNELNRQTAESERVSNETARQTAESARESNESLRQSSESARATAEASRDAAESARVSAEQSRVSAESARSAAEIARQTTESERATNETARVTAESARASAESARQTAETQRQAEHAAAVYEIDSMTVSASRRDPESDPLVTISTVDSHKHISFGIPVGEPFKIKKTFATIAEMNAYSGTDVKTGDFVLIVSNVEDPDNAKLYVKTDIGYSFIVDLSGSQGFKGETGNGIASVQLNNDYTLTVTYTDGTYSTTGSIRGATGNGIQNVTLNNDYTLTITFTDGNSVTTGAIRGETGNGIASVQLNNDYTLTISFTDGTSVTTNPIRGATGETGNGIASVQLNNDYTLTITFTNGTSVTTDPIRGATGETGNGIASAVFNSDNTLTLIFTNGTSLTTGSLKGEKGDPGTGGSYISYNSSDDCTVVVFG